MANFKKIVSRVIYRSRQVPRIRKPFISLFNIQPLEREEWLNSSKFIKLAYSGSESLVVGEAVLPSNTDINIKGRLEPFIRQIEEPLVYVVPNARLLSPLALGFTDDGRFIRDTSFPYFINSKATHLERSIKFSTIWQYLFTKPERIIPCAASLFNEWNSNYFEWMTNTLPRLQGIEAYETSIGKSIPLFVTNKLTSWQKETLRLMNRSNYEVWDNQPTLVKKLVVPSFRKFYCYNTGVYKNASIDGIKWVRDRILTNVSNENKSKVYPEYVYISREDAIGRRVVNELEVMNLLTPLGFTLVKAEMFSVEEQALLFHRAKVIIAPHGAGLINLMYGNENLKVVELTGETLPTPAFAEISRGLGFKYGLLSSANVGSGWDANIHVSLPDLMSLLKQMGIV